MADRHQIVRLAHIISYNTACLQYHMDLQKVPPLSFDADSRADRRWITAMETARNEIEKATRELHDLVRQPQDLLTDHPEIHAAKAFISKFDIANRVPRDGSISYQTLSEQIGVDQSAVESLLRLAIAHRIFSEDAAGRLAHSPASKNLPRGSTSPADNSLANTVTLTKALENFPSASGAAQSAASLTDDLRIEGLRHEYLFRDSDGETIAPRTDLWLSHGDVAGQVWESLVKIFDWGRRPSGVLFVDISGDGGEFAMHAADNFPHLRWIVVGPNQPLPEMSTEHPSIFHHQQPFFRPLPNTTRCGSGFLFRRVLCDYSDQECHQILQSVIPVIASKARIYIIDRVLPRMGEVPNDQERTIRAQAVRHMALCNGRERNMAQWRRLLVNADPVLRRFRLLSTRKVEGSDLTVLDVEWGG